MAEYGVTSEGFLRPTLDEIKTELETAFKAKFGDAINLTPNSPIGNIVGVMAERENLLWEKMEDWYNQLDPDSAEDEAQDRLYRINNQERKPASYSTCPVTITGDPGTIVDGPPNPFSVYVQGDVSAVFAMTEQLTIPVGGVLSTTLTATQTGPILAPKDTLTEILTPKTGITSVVNGVEDAMAGQNAETSEKFRQRRLRNLRRSGSATLKGIIATVDLVEGVTLCGGSENKSNQVDVNGLPPKSVEIYAAGGDDEDIAEAIAGAIAGGIEAFGDVLVDVEDSEGNLQSIGFSRPTGVPIYIIAEVEPNQDVAEGDVYPADGDARLIEAIATYGNEIAYLGHNVSPFQLARGGSAEVSGVMNLTLKIGREEDPTSTDVLIIAPNELPQFDASRISVVRV